jgi:hypothetical protein
MKMKQHFLCTGLLAVFMLAGLSRTNAQTSPITSPVVSIVNPANGAVFFTPTNITITAAALARNAGGVITVDSDVTNVAFFAGTNFLGSVSAPPVVTPPPGSLAVVPIISPAFTISWSNAPVGVYALTAVATDTQGLMATSAPVNITVQPGPPPPPPTNLPPVVRIISPPNQALFRAPLNLPLFAFACVPTPAAAAAGAVTVTNVEFFANTTNDLGPGNPLRIVLPVTVTPITSGPATPGPVTILPLFGPTNEWDLIWSNAPPGVYVLTAVASDSAGLSATSAPVNITILPPLPPPTNRPDVVNIVATDPIAIEGTNCWLTPVPTPVPLTPSWSNWPPVNVLFMTNCGPKNATFTVRRFGETNDDLTVAYNIGGTASNGVDYVMLPGVATVPAGLRAALITVVPIDNGPLGTNKTVVLTLAPDTNTPPDYLVGLPRRAAALIVDSDHPYPLPVILPDKCFHLNAAGPNGAWFYVEYSTNLVDWLPVCTNQVVGGAIDFVDPDAVGDQQRFYRAIPEDNPPSD